MEQEGIYKNFVSGIKHKHTPLYELCCDYSLEKKRRYMKNV